MIMKYDLSQFPKRWDEELEEYLYEFEGEWLPKDDVLRILNDMNAAVTMGDVVYRMHGDADDINTDFDDEYYEDDEDDDSDEEDDCESAENYIDNDEAEAVRIAREIFKKYGY